MRNYHVHTEKFGVVTIADDNLAGARKRAKRIWGVGPGAVTVAPRAPIGMCYACDSAPCICHV